MSVEVVSMSILGENEVLEALSYTQWRTVKEVREILENTHHERCSIGVIYLILTRLLREGTVESRYKENLLGQECTVHLQWRRTKDTPRRDSVSDEWLRPQCPVPS